MSTGQHRNTTTQTRYRAQVRAQRQPCALCGGDIDYTLRTPHPDSFEIDHVIPLKHGGPDTLDNCQPSHRRCNRAKSDRLAPEPPKPGITTWRTWWTQGGNPQADTRRTPKA